MHVPFERVSPEALAAAWNQFYPQRFHVSPQLLRANTIDSPLFDWGASIADVEGDRVTGFVAVKKSAAPLYPGPDPDQAHINSLVFSSPTQGVDLLKGTKRLLRNRGIYRLVFGQDSGHFFPGCPKDCPGLFSFLTVEGFEVMGNAVDLERNLEDYSPTKPLPDTVIFRPCESADRASLAAFLNREFPGRWTFDTLAMFDRAGPEMIMGLFKDDACEGFALLQMKGLERPIGGAVWYLDLGQNWASLGPIGVSKKLRGQGLGESLLSAGLLELKSRGAKRTIIDWTTLVDFYGAQGFQVAREYACMALAL